MTDERDGITDVPEPGEPVGTPGEKREIIQTNDERLAPSEGCKRPDGSPSEEELAAFTQEFTSATAFMQEYDSLLPPANQFNAYSPEAQKALIDFANRQVKAAFDDESARQDKLAEAEIKQGNRGLVGGVIIILADIVGAVIAGAISGNWGIVSAFMLLPIAAVIGNIYKPTRSKGVDDPRKYNK